MATHDYDIANQSGAAFRTDLNNALAAIQSNNSNSSSPATTVAYQWWADTSAGTLKIRNSSNNAWIELFQLDGTLTLEDGSAAAPALSFRDDLDTGIYSAGANNLNFATNGVSRFDLSNSNTVFNEGGNDIDFRIESNGNVNMFKIDAGNNRVGIGEGSPSTTLHVNGDLTITEKIIHNGDSNTFISFTADDNVIIQTGGAERFRVADLGTTISTTTDASLFINSSASGGAHLRFQTSGTTKSFIGQAEGISGTLGSADDLGFRSAAKINFATNNDSTKRLEIETGGDVKVSTGNLVVANGQGINFAATADSAATGATDSSELFNDYEEGTWTPIYQNNDNSPTFDVQTGRYTKVGRFVYCTGRLSVQGGTALETNDGSGVNIGGLPFSGNSDHHACLLTLGRFLSIFQDGGANVNTVRFGGNFILLMTANGNEVTYTECNSFGDLTFALSYQL